MPTQRKEFSTAPYLVVPQGTTDHPTRIENSFRRALQNGEGLEAIDRIAIIRDNLDAFFEQDPIMALYRIFVKSPDNFRGDIFEQKVTIAEPPLKELNDDLVDTDGANELVEIIDKTISRNFAGHRDHETACFTIKGIVSLIDFSDLFDEDKDYSDEEIADLIYLDLKERLQNCKDECRAEIIRYFEARKAEYSGRARELTDIIITSTEDTSSEADELNILTSRISNLRAYIEKLEKGEGLVLGIGGSPFRIEAEDSRSLEAFREVVSADLKTTIASRSANARLKDQDKKELHPGQTERTGIQVLTTLQYPIADLMALRTKIVRAIMGIEEESSEVKNWASILRIDPETQDIFDLDGNIVVEPGILKMIRKKHIYKGSAPYMRLLEKDPGFEEKLALIEKFIEGGISPLDYIPNFVADEIDVFHKRVVQALDLDEQVDALADKEDVNPIEIGELNSRVDRLLQESLKNRAGGQFLSQYGLIRRIVDQASIGSVLYIGDRRNMWVDNTMAYWGMAMELVEQLTEAALRELPHIILDPEFDELAQDLKLNPDFQKWAQQCATEERHQRMLAGFDSEDIQFAETPIRAYLKVVMKDILLPDRRFRTLWMKYFDWDFDKDITGYLLKGCDKPTDEFKDDLETIQLQNPEIVGTELVGDEFTCIARGVTETDQGIIRIAENIRNEVNARVAVVVIDIDLEPIIQESEDPVKELASLVTKLNTLAEEELVRAKDDEYNGKTTPIRIFKASDLRGQEPDFFYSPAQLETASAE